MLGLFSVGKGASRRRRATLFLESRRLPARKKDEPAKLRNHSSSRAHQRVLEAASSRRVVYGRRGRSDIPVSNRPQTRDHMCGLAGIAVPRSSGGWSPTEAVRRMTGSLAHRGPDDEGVWEDRAAGVVLGFRRLSIMDLSSAGNQPMTSASGRFVLTFNGEIYNFRELRDELDIPPQALRSGSDTEVLLEAIDRLGVERALERLRGMFAIAAFDTEERILWLARDRLGVKPLYVLHRPEGLAFASEARAFHRCPLFGGGGDPDVAKAFLDRLYVPGTKSILQGVERVAPGEVRAIRVGNERVEEIVRNRYWSLEQIATAAPPTLGDETEAADKLLELLRESIRYRLIADVPVGAFLSGGLDSSVVVAIMQELSSQPVQTFTIGFDDPRFDESDAAGAVADILGTSHTSIRFSETEVLDLIPMLARVSDEPMANPSLLPTLMVSRAARRSVVVALSGDGGDELFGGYNRYVHGARLVSLSRRSPLLVRRAAAAILERVGSTAAPDILRRIALRGSVGKQHSAHEQVLKVARLLREQDEISAYRRLLGVGMADLLTAGPPPDDEEAGTTSVWRGLTVRDRMMLLDQLDYLPGDLLAKVDRASMWESLEARVPLLDHRIVELSWRMTPRLKIRGGRGKWPLRRIAERYFPPAHLHRPKMGFTVPIVRWLRCDLREWSRDLLGPEVVREVGVCDPRMVEAAWRRFDEGYDHVALPLWTAAVLHAWSREWGVRFGHH